jgi:osmoprotectant transport system permease protein
VGSGLTAIVEHLRLTALAMALGLVVSAALAAIALRFRWTMTPITATTSLIYTLPSVALFALLAPVFGNLSLLDGRAAARRLHAC